MSEELWPHSPLSELSLAIKDGSHGTHKRVLNGVPFLSAKNVSESGMLQWGDEDDRISEEDYTALCSTFTPRADDLLLTIVGTLGRRAVFDGARVAFQRSVAFVRPDVQKVLPRYLFHAAGSHDFSRQLVRRSNATAQAGLYLGELEKTTIPMPPPPDKSPDQSCIAAVLDTVDEAIAKTEAVIAKLRQVRAGLLHDLLTRGLDKNGQLRDPIAHPELFQDAPLGQIPKEWNVKPIGDFVVSSAFGPRFPGDLYDENGNVATMRTTDMDDDGNLDLDAMPLARLFVSEFTEHILVPNDVLVSRSGTCGITAVFHGFRKPVLPGAFLIRFRLGKGLLPEFLRTALNWTPNRQRLLVRAEGGVQKNLRTDSISGLTLSFPDELEQEKILSALAVQQSRLDAEDGQLAKLRLLKSGLMTDLLTGRVRVPPQKAN